MNLKDKLLKVLGFRFCIRSFDVIFKPSPYQEFSDYNEYWERRQEQGKHAPELLRYKIVASRLPQGARVLDIGCGDGAFLSYLKRKRPDCVIFGVDVSGKAVGILKSNGINGQVIDPDQPLRQQIDSDWDHIVLMEVLEHIADAESMIRQVCEFCPTKIFISIPNLGFIGDRLRLLIGGMSPTTCVFYHMREHLRFWTVKDFRRWATFQKLQVKKVFGQYGVISIFVKYYPSLFAQGVVYELEPLDK